MSGPSASLEARPHLSVVVPAFQEEAAIGAVVGRVFAVLGGLGFPFEVVVCDDGSRDGTSAVLAGLQARHPGLRTLRHEHNQGVGQALKTLYRDARGEWVVFLPADGQVDADQVPRLLEGRSRAAVVLGARHPRRDPLPRLLASWGYNLLVRLLLGLRVRDVDSVTLYRRDVLDIDFRSRDLCLPVEILLKAHRRGLAYVEVPVDHLPRRSGRAWGANPRVALRSLADLFLAWWSPSHWGR